MDAALINQLFFMTWQLIVMYAPYLAGIAIPHVVEYLNKDVLQKDEWLRALVTLLTCLGFSLLFHWNDFSMDNLDSLSNFFLLYFIEAWAIWTFWFKKSATRSWIQDVMSVGLRSKIKTFVYGEKIEMTKKQ